MKFVCPEFPSSQLPGSTPARLQAVYPSKEVLQVVDEDP